MSRLIFEGDTTKRFGEKFPRPFIEQVRAYDNGVEVDIAFYFKVPNDDDSVAAFLSSLREGALSQSIVLSAIAEKSLNTLKSSKDFNVLSEAFMQQGSNLEDTTFARRRIISMSDFINGKLTPPPPPEQAPRNYAEYIGAGSGERLNAGAGVRINTGAGVGMGPIAAPGTTTEEDATTEYSSYNVAIKDDFYNQEGTRFMKIFGTLSIDYNASDEMYITCFVKND